jgi:uncharacterized protein
VTASERPLPTLTDPVTRPFWEACRRHELRLQRCRGCHRVRFYPAPLCPHCHQGEADWEPLSGRGTVASFVVVHPPVLPAFASRVPFAVALVELDEDPRIRLLGNVLDCAPDAVAIGMRVQVAWEDVGDVTLPQWRPLR